MNASRKFKRKRLKARDEKRREVPYLMVLFLQNKQRRKRPRLRDQSLQLNASLLRSQASPTLIATSNQPFLKFGKS